MQYTTARCGVTSRDQSYPLLPISSWQKQASGLGQSKPAVAFYTSGCEMYPKRGYAVV